MWKTEQDLLKKHRKRLDRKGAHDRGKRRGSRQDNNTKGESIEAKENSAEKEEKAVAIALAQPIMPCVRSKKKRARFQARKKNYGNFTSLDLLEQEQLSGSDDGEDFI